MYSCILAFTAIHFQQVQGMVIVATDVAKCFFSNNAYVSAMY